MVSLIFAAAALAAASPLPLRELPVQRLTAGDCALVLWERSTGRRVAMLVLRPDGIRIHHDGVVKTLPKISGNESAIGGFAPNARFGDGHIRIATALTIVAGDVAGSAIIRDGMISVTEADGLEIVAPVAGIAGCGS